MTEPNASQEQYLRWLEEIRGIGGANPLTNLDLDVLGLVNLERCHPVGLSMFTKSHRGLLANLVRDPIAYSKALTEAKRAKIKSERLLTNYGIQSLYLLAGAVDFSPAKLDLRIPVMLWRAELIRKGADFELGLVGEPFVNPELILTLRNQYGLSLDTQRLTRIYIEANDLVPISLLSFVAESTKSISDLEIQRTLVLTNATLTPTFMLNELPKSPTKLAQAILNPEIDLPKANSNLEALLVADADTTQISIVNKALNGDSFAVETLPGTGYTQTVVNMLAALTAENKRALVLSPRRQTLNELIDRISHVGLSGLLVRSHNAWLDIVSALSRFEKATYSNLPAAKANQAGLEEKLDRYFDSLERTHPVLGISINDALAKLAELSALPKPPKTSARITGPALFENRNRTAAIALLNEAVELGEFDKANHDSPWFNAQFDDASEIPRITALTRRLSEDVLPQFSVKLDDFIEQVGFPPAENVAQWGEYIRLLISIRATLDRFTPDVFDRPLDDLITATSPRKDKTAMSGKTRRALSKHAKEYVRPGVSVGDLNSALLQIAEQAKAWKQLSKTPVAPVVPIGIEDTQVTYQSLVADLIKLDSHLDQGVMRSTLLEIPLPELGRKLQKLNEDPSPLENIAVRNDLRRRVGSLGLESLVKSLATSNAKNEHLVAEFDQCWWLSALEYLLSGDNAFVHYSPESLAELEADFVNAELLVQSETRQEISARTATAWKSAIQEFPKETENLRALLKQRVTKLLDLNSAAPNIWPKLASHVAVSSYEVAEILKKDTNFDVLLVLDAAGTTVAENLSGIVRAKQIVVFGDPVIADPNGFEVEWQLALKPRAPEAPSIYEIIANRFGVETLRRSYRTKGQLFGPLINREFYQGRIVLEPSAAEFNGESSLELIIVDGDTRANRNVTASTEAPLAEVNKVIELVLEHVSQSPEQSLLVVSASSVEVEAIYDALQISLDSNPELREFFEKHGRERFEITSLADLNHRLADRIIFSIGFGRTPSGKILSHFGLLNEPEAKRWVANMLVSARYKMTIVSCFSSYDLPELRSEGATDYLATLLKPSYSDSIESDSFDSDPMLADLARRLKRFGVRVVEGFGQRIPLIASYGNQNLVVEPDWSNSDLNYTERIRLRPALLKLLGWTYHRVYSFEVFSDPQAVAERIATRFGIEVTPTMLNTVPVARVFEDSDAAWGDHNSSNDQRLREDKPPHWG
jgi:hypothetical protein